MLLRKAAGLAALEAGGDPTADELAEVGRTVVPLGAD